MALGDKLPVVMETDFEAELSKIRTEMLNKANWQGGIMQGGSVKEWAVKAGSNRLIAAESTATDTPYPAYWLLSTEVAADGGWIKLTATNVLTLDQQYCIYNVGVWSEWRAMATATLPEEHYLPLSEGVSAIQKNYYLKRQDSCVEVRFSVSFPPTDGRIKVIAALPAGYLPGNTEADSCTAIEAVGDVMGAAKVEVLSNGVVQIYANAAGAIGAAGSIVFTATH